MYTYYIPVQTFPEEIWSIGYGHSIIVTGFNVVKINATYNGIAVAHARVITG
jgi:hypothetical protein